MMTVQRIKQRPTLGIFWSDGILQPQDRFECREKQWVPLMCYRKKGNAQLYVPVFDDVDTASRFIERNVPKGWVRGVFTLLTEEIAWCQAQGWTLDPMNYPKRLYGHPSLDVFAEVMEYSQKPDLFFRPT